MSSLSLSTWYRGCGGIWGKYTLRYTRGEGREDVNENGDGIWRLQAPRAFGIYLSAHS